MEYKIFAISGNSIEEYASFEDDGYSDQILNKIEKRKCERLYSNVDYVMENVFANKQGVAKKYLKTAMRALRHFDEVGLSNDIYDVLEEINDDGSYDGVLFDEYQNIDGHLIDLEGYSI